MPESPAPGATVKAVLLVAFMWVAYFLNYCDRLTVVAMFPVLEKELGLSDTQQGLTVAIFIWVYGALSPVAGQLADRFSKRRLVVFSLAVWSVVTVATGFATSALVLLALRAAMGIVESLYMPAALALTSNAFPPTARSRVVSIFMTAQIAGLVGGNWFGGWMADHGRWRSAFWVLGAVGLIYAVPYFLFLRGVNEENQIETRKAGAKLALSELVKVPTFLLLCVVFPMFCFGLWLLYGWFPNFLHDKFKLNMTDAGFNATVFIQGATLIGILCGGVLADWLYRRTKAARFWVLTASLLLCAPCLHALGGASTLEATRFAAVCFGLASGLWVGNILAAALDVVPADTRASSVGMLNFCAAFLSGLAPLFGGMWKKSIGIERLLSYTAILYIVSAALLVVGIKLFFRRDYERVHAESLTSVSG